MYDLPNNLKLVYNSYQSIMQFKNMVYGFHWFSICSIGHDGIGTVLVLTNTEQTEQLNPGGMVSGQSCSNSP